MRIQRWTLQGIDSVLACASLSAAFFIRDALADWLPVGLTGIGTVVDYMIFWPLLLVAAPLVLQWLRYYQVGSLEKGFPLVNLALQAALFLFLAMVMFQFVFSLQMSRLVFVFFIPIYTGALLARTRVYREWQRRVARRGSSTRNVVIARDAGGVTVWRQLLEGGQEQGFRVVREVELPLVSLREFVDILHEESVELVVFDVKTATLDRVSEAIWACEDEGIEAWLSVDFLQVRYARAKFLDFGDRPVLVFSRAPENSFQLFLKELMDRVGAALALVVLSPLLLVVALLVKWTSPGPILFRQERS
ncbi:MAG: sugar transferase, partial [Verrucomicrobiia bacterium]